MDLSCSLLNLTDSLLKYFKVLSQRAVIVILGTICKEEVSLDNLEAGFSCRGMIFFCWCFLAQPGPAESPSPTPCATLHPSVPEGAQGHARRAQHFINARKTAPAVGLQLARAPEQESEHWQPLLLQACTAVGQFTLWIIRASSALGLELS